MCIVSPNRDYHLSEKYIGKHNFLRPGIDHYPSGVCFAPSIRECLEAVPFYYSDGKDWVRRKRFVQERSIWYVYTPANQQMAIIPETIGDFNRTHEKRTLGKSEVVYIGKIKVNIRGNSWQYKWIK